MRGREHRTRCRSLNKALITGGAGFIGAALGKYLVARGYSLDLVDNFSRGVHDFDLEVLLSDPAVRILELDLRSVEMVGSLPTDYRYIYHLAAIVGVEHVLKRPYAVLHDNFLMLANVLEAARRQQRIERLVFASTSEVYAGTLQHFSLPVPTPEDAPLALTDLREPRTSYMLSKLCGEALCHQAGVPVSIVRPHNVYGPRMGLVHVIPELLKKAHMAESGGSLEVFSVDHRRTFCYVDDAVEMIHGIADAPAAAGGTFNIGTQAPEISMGELAELILRVVGKRLIIIPKLPTAGSPARRCPEMTRTIRLTGYRAKTGLEEGIDLTNRWYREHVFRAGGLSAT